MRHNQFRSINANESSSRWTLHNYDNRGIEPVSYHISNNVDMKIMPGHIETGPQLMINRDGTYYDGKFVINTTIPGIPNQIGYSQNNMNNNNNYYNQNDIYPQSMAPRQHKLRQKERLRSKRFKSKQKHYNNHKKKSKSKRCGPTPPRFLNQRMKQHHKQRSNLYSSQSYSYSNPAPIPPLQSMYTNPSPVSPIYVPSPISSSDSFSFCGGSGSSGSEKENGDHHSVIDPMINMDHNITLPMNTNYDNIDTENVSKLDTNENEDVTYNLNDHEELSSQFPDLRITANENFYEHGNELENANTNNIINPRIIPVKTCLDFYIANIQI